MIPYHIVTWKSIRYPSKQTRRFRSFFCNYIDFFSTNPILARARRFDRGSEHCGLCYHTRIAGCTCCACFAENICQQFPQIWYVRQVSVILVLWSVNLVLSLVIRARSVSVYVYIYVSIYSFALFSITKLTAIHNLYPLNRRSLLPSNTNTSYKAGGDAVRWLGMSRWVGAAKSSDASQPVNL